MGRRGGALVVRFADVQRLCDRVAAVRALAMVRRWLARVAADWRADSERLNEYNRAVCAQRDAERAEWLIWRGIVQ